MLCSVHGFTRRRRLLDGPAQDRSKPGHVVMLRRVEEFRMTYHSKHSIRVKKKETLKHSAARIRNISAHCFLSSPGAGGQLQT
jgi:hypothetical protein